MHIDTPFIISFIITMIIIGLTFLITPIIFLMTSEIPSCIYESEKGCIESCGCTWCNFANCGKCHYSSDAQSICRYMNVTIARNCITNNTPGIIGFYLVIVFISITLVIRIFTFIYKYLYSEYKQIP